MNKYWIHSCTGQKCEVYKEGDPVKLSWKNPSGKPSSTYFEVSKKLLRKYYIPITEDEYNSPVTLKKIEGSRNSLFDWLAEGDKVLCKSDCRTKEIDIEAEDILRVESKTNCGAVLYGLSDGIKGKKVSLLDTDINEHFAFYIEDIKSENTNKEAKELLKESWKDVPVNPLEVGGTHYQQPIQPWDYIYSNHLGFDEGNVVKYISRHKEKNGAEDIKKAISYCKHILETQYGEKD